MEIAQIATPDGNHEGGDRPVVYVTARELQGQKCREWRHGCRHGCEQARQPRAGEARTFVKLKRTRPRVEQLELQRSRVRLGQPLLAEAHRGLRRRIHGRGQQRRRLRRWLRRG